MERIGYSLLKKLCSTSVEEMNKAFNHVFEKYRYLVYYVSFDILKSEDEAKDIVNETFLKMYERRTYFMSESKLKYFLLVTARNLSIDRYREQAKKLYRTTEGFDPENASRLRKAAHLVAPLVSKVYSWRDAYRKFDEECRRYNDLPTKYVGKISFQPYGIKMYDLRSEFEGTEYLDFEMLKVPVPSGYKVHLRRQYGDYNKFVIGTADHGKLILDPDIPYKEWIRRYRENPEELIHEPSRET